jgi:starvation-inducible DNA-binding protein
LELANRIWSGWRDQAARIRTLGAYAPASFSEFSALTGLDEGKPDTKAVDIIKLLVADNLKMAETAQALGTSAEEAGGEVTANLAIGRHQVGTTLLGATD